MTYYNTTKEEGQTLISFEGKANDQEQKVLDFYKIFKGKHTPSMIWSKCFGKSIPLTSVRRSMSDLTFRGLLKKTTDKKMGLYGRPEYCWSCATKNL